jgi:hypothetical protein
VITQELITGFAIQFSAVRDIDTRAVVSGHYSFWDNPQLIRAIRG